MSQRTLFPCLAVCLLVLGLGCDSASPVAPTGTLLSISASPNEIATSGTSTIRVTALKANGTPVNPGTIVRLDTTLGTIDAQVEIDDQGTATATLRGDGRIGTATVTARSGSAESATVEVAIGKTASSVSLQATPSSIPETGGTVELLALVRDDQGQPLPGSTVNFTTSLGVLTSQGGFVTTGADGAARDTLTVTESEISTLSGDQFQIGVEAGGSSSQANISIQRPPDAEFTFTRSGRTVVFQDMSTNNPTSWNWDFGDTQTSTLQNPSHTFSSDGDKVVMLTVRNAIGTDSVSQIINIPATGP